MMSDRELLERAAKAAGIVGGVFHEGNDYLIATIDYDDENDCRCFWNPLEHNHQAFELAVKLNMSVRVYGGNVMIYDMADKFIADCVDTEDPTKAARKAIVFAAAEMANA
jgi:hypothetical protein